MRAAPGRVGGSTRDLPNRAPDRKDTSPQTGGLHRHRPNSRERDCAVTAEHKTILLLS